MYSKTSPEGVIYSIFSSFPEEITQHAAAVLGHGEAEGAFQDDDVDLAPHESDYSDDEDITQTG